MKIKVLFLGANIPVEEVEHQSGDTVKTILGKSRWEDYKYKDRCVYRTDRTNNQRSMDYVVPDNTERMIVCGKVI